MGLKDKPNRERARERASKVKAGEKRIVADVPERIHVAVRKHCLDKGVLVRDFILELLAEKGIR